MLLTSQVKAQDNMIDFESERWILKNAEIVTHLGRKALAGAAYLKDVQLENGIIEVDIAVSGARSYPGIIFRMQSPENFERFYLRPHRASLYPDALQYTPVFNRVEGWQLYSGKGFTAAAAIPANQWNHIKMDFSGTQARVYLNNDPKPALVIHDLKHGVSKGSVGIYGPKNKTAYFSNFKYRVDNNLKFDPPPKTETPANMITEWEISQPFNASRLDIATAKYPRFFQIFNTNWRKVTPEASGLVNISRYETRSGPKPDCIFARTIIRSNKKQPIRLSFGYSDEVSIFLNGKKVFYGNSAYRYRDPSFVGIVGLHDAVYLTLEKGLNEIFLMVKETFGGWGFMCQADHKLHLPIKQHHRTKKVWETPKVFLTPESVRYDPKREILYVTNFDSKFKRSATKIEEFTGYISKVKLNGEIENLKWVTGLHAPCGMSIYQDKLYTVERANLVEIDIESGKILKRYPIPGCDFPNDIAVDSAGNIYISDTSPSSHIDSRIYKFKNGKFEVWLNSDEIIRANGLFMHENHLIVGNTGDGCLKSVDLANKKITKIACLGASVLDGIRVDNQGNFLVSHWEGHTYLVSPSGQVVEILDTMPAKVNSADFEFIKEKNLLIIPTFLDNRVMAYRLE
jgi:DNA-binding beta-propeller fold protein YncE